MPMSSCPARRSTRASITGGDAGRLVAGWQGAGLGLPPATIYPSACLRINNGLLLWEPADLLPAPTPAAQPPGFPGPSGFWHDNFKMCKSAFKLGRRSTRRGPRAPEPPELGRAGAATPGLLPTRLLDLTPDSDSDDEDARFFSVGASSAPQAPAPESPSPHSQSTFSTLVTVLKGRITALCETKVRAAGGGEPPPSEPPQQDRTRAGSAK